MNSDQPGSIRFTKHAREKFALLSSYGFEIDEATVRRAIEDPIRTDTRGNQLASVETS